MQRRKLKITIESFLINAISKTSRDQVDLAFGRQRCLSQRLPNPPRKRSLEAIVIDQIHVLLIDRIASTLLMIDDIVDFRASMRGREVAEAVYIQYSTGCLHCGSNIALAQPHFQGPLSTNFHQS